MSYTNLDANGNALPDSATSWAMVKVNVIGLIWEMKTNKDGVENYNDPHDADNFYTWYDSNPATNGGFAGYENDGKNTENFIKALNNAHYGGYEEERSENSITVDGNPRSPSIWIKHSTGIKEHWALWIILTGA